MLRAAHTLAHLRKLYKQVSILDQLVTIQEVAINNHELNVLITAFILDGQVQTTICHSSEDRLLQYMDKEMEDNLRR
jgi:hypothetical protein